MINEIYNSRIGAIKTYHFHNEWAAPTIPHEKTLTEELEIIFNKLFDLQSDTVADKIKTTYYKQNFMYIVSLYFLPFIYTKTVFMNFLSEK